MTPNYPRLAAYFTASFTLGMMVYIFTNLFYPFMQRADWVGTLVMILYALVYLSLTFSIGRRFIRKTNTHFWLPYAMVPMIVLPTAAFSHYHEKFSMAQELVIFMVIITAGSIAGAYYSIKSGLLQREKLIAQIQERREAAEKAATRK